MKYEGSVALRKRRLWIYALWEAALVGGLSAFAIHARHATPLLDVYLLIAVLFLSAMGWTLVERNRSSRNASLRIDDEGVWLDGAVALPRAKIAPGAHLRPHDKGEIGVRIPARGFGTLDVDVADANEGRRVLAALGQDPAHAKVRFRLASGFENKTLRTFATAVLAVSSSCGGIINGQQPVFRALFAMWIVAICIAGISFLLPTYVTIGTDGIFVERSGRKRFVPFKKIASIGAHPKHHDAVLVAVDGEDALTLRTSVQDRDNASLVVSDQTRALRTQLDESLTAFRVREAGGDASLHLKRGGRTPREWIEALERLRNESGYRETTITDEQLWRILEDPGAAPEDRAAALIALRKSVGDAERDRVRVAMETSAEPRLRVVYDAAAKDDEAELEVALEALHENA